jgi:hypothetical protein
MNGRVTWKRTALLGTAAACLVLASGAFAAEKAPLATKLGPGSVLWLDGTSTMHDFESRSKELTVELSRESGAAQPADATGLMALIRSSGVLEVRFEVPVASLKSDKDALDKNLRKAMKAEQHPKVAFVLKKYSIAPGPAAGDTVAIEAEGLLTVAGQERPISLAARAYPAAEGVWLEGSEKLLMSEYGIEPPKMFLGTLKVHDPITIHYRLFLIPKGEGMASAPVHN